MKKLNESEKEKSVYFSIEQDWNNIELLRISPDWFFYRWEKVEDINNIYKRFCEWMNLVESKK